MGYRKFLMGLIGLIILITMLIVVLVLFLYSLISGDRFIDFVIEIGKVVGIIVSAFMAVNMATHVVQAIEKKGEKNHDK
jgi:uncharacterized membrane protein required for colicin V production